MQSGHVRGEKLVDTVTLTKAFVRCVEKLSKATKRTPEAVVKSALDSGLDYEEWFLKQVDAGVAEANRGDLISHEEVVRNFQKLRKSVGNREPLTLLIYQARSHAVEVLRVLHHSRKYP